MSKQAAIREIEGELNKPETYLFKQHLDKLEKEGVPKGHELVVALNVLISETARSCKEKKIAIGKKYMKKLKSLSILTCFFGCTTYTLSQLMRQLDCSRQQSLDLLLEASIFELVSIQIDESAGVIKIQKAKIREREVGEGMQKCIQGKLSQIKSRNQKLQQKISGLVNKIEGKKYEAEPSKITSIFSGFRS